MIGQRGSRPAEITAVTFTNQAAGEMRARLEQELGKRAVRGLTVGTFHAIALDLLRQRREPVRLLAANGRHRPENRQLSLFDLR